jgi:Flp pilus assembly protein TadD
VRLSPDDPAILEHLGDVYLEAGRERQALETYRKALQLKPENEAEQQRIEEKVRIIEKQGGR